MVNKMQTIKILETFKTQDLQNHTWDMEKISCPICGCEKSEIAYKWDCPYESCPMTFLIARCKKCRFLFTNPRLSRSSLEQYYSKISPYADDTYHPIDILRFRFEYFIKALYCHGLTKGNLLEIGCDKGQFLQIAIENGFQVTGIEPSIGAEFAENKLGIHVYRQHFENVNLPENTFDCIVMLDVLEHIYNPSECLHKIYKLLAPGGLLLVKVPNVRHEHGIYPLLRGKSALGFGAHEHLSHFSMQSLTNAMNNANLEVIDWLGFLPIMGPDIFRKVFKILYNEVGMIGKKIWKNWYDYNVSLVCLARKADPYNQKSE